MKCILMHRTIMNVTCKLPGTLKLSLHLALGELDLLNPVKCKRAQQEGESGKRINLSKASMFLKCSFSFQKLLDNDGKIVCSEF